MLNQPILPQSHLIFETRDSAGDLLVLHYAGSYLLSGWEHRLLSRVRPPESEMSERERMAVRRILDRALDANWDFPAPAEPPLFVAERAVRRALGLDGIKRKKRERGEPRIKKLTRQDAELDCPICRTGAKIRCWNNGAGSVTFYCQNRRCVRKMPHYQAWHPGREEKIFKK